MTGRQRIDWAATQMPVLGLIRQDFEKTKPLQGLLVGACMHITKETAVLFETLQAGGAKVIACPSNPLSTQDDVVDALIAVGIQVIGHHGMSEEDYKNALESVARAKPDFVMDDGGDLTRAVLALGHIPLGGLEETTTGVRVIKKLQAQGVLTYPIVAVNDTPTKRLFDNVYGTGQSTIDALMRATNYLLAGKTLVVAGFGHCGRGIALRARGMGCDVVVTEIDSTKALQALMEGYRVMTMAEAAKKADIIITATGNINVVKTADLELKDGALLANAGHFDVEISVKGVIDQVVIDENIVEYQKGKNTFLLLNEGRLVNLASGEGHPSAVMDMSFSNQALCAEWLSKENNLVPQVLNVPSEIDERVAELKLKSLGVKIDKLTPEQQEYYYG